MYDQLCHKKTNLVSACNGFTDFCDEFDEVPADIKSGKAVPNKLSVEAVKLVRHNHSTATGIDNRKKRSPSTLHTEEKMHSQVTTILDKLLFDSGYDNQIRPQINGPPVQVIFAHQSIYHYFL